MYPKTIQHMYLFFAANQLVWQMQCNIFSISKTKGTCPIYLKQLVNVIYDFDDQQQPMYIIYIHDHILTNIYMHKQGAIKTHVFIKTLVALVQLYVHSIGCPLVCRLLYAYVILIIFGFVRLSVFRSKSSLRSEKPRWEKSGLRFLFSKSPAWRWVFLPSEGTARLNGFCGFLYFCQGSYTLWNKRRYCGPRRQVLT